MTPLEKFNAVIIACTTLFMYLLWLGISKLMEINTISFFVITILSGLISLGFYRSVATLLRKFFNNNKMIKKKILGNYYLEGTWVGFFVGNNGKIRYICERFEQSLEGIIIQGSSYTDNQKIHGNWIAKSPVVNIEEKQLMYYYEADMINNLFINPGLASFKMEKSHKSHYIDSLRGFSSDLYNPHKLFAIEEKISDDFIDDEEAILLRAKELYQKYKNMLPE